MTNLQEFFRYWNKRVKSGASSPIGRLEGMMLEIYDEWLRAKKKAGGQPMIVHTEPAPKKPSAWARYEVFYSMSGTRIIEASSPEDAMAKFMAFSTAELAEDAELESLDPVLVNEENAT